MARPGTIDLDAQRALPLQIMWPDFAINTVFYAGILWLLFAALFALRKRRRIKLGLCPKCAYDLRNRPADSSVCPECGATHAVTVSGARWGEESRLV